MYFLVAIYKPLVIFSFNSILTQGKNMPVLTCNMSNVYVASECNSVGSVWELGMYFIVTREYFFN